MPDRPHPYVHWCACDNCTRDRARMIRRHSMPQWRFKLMCMWTDLHPMLTTLWARVRRRSRPLDEWEKR